VQQAPQAVVRQTRGNPLAAGLIAFGAGWLVSSLLPASQREQELAEQAKQRASEIGQPLVDAAKDAAMEMKDNLQEPAQHAVESVRDTAADAGRTVTEEGRSAAQDVQDHAQDAAGTVTQSPPH
jgi:gas vesicle protein